MATETEREPSRVGREDATNCDSCGGELAPGQRYCLNCGARTRAPLVALEDAVAPLAQVPAKRRRYRERALWLGVLGGALTGAVLVVLGLLLGRASVDEDQPVVNVRVPEQKAPVVNVTNTGGGAAPVEEAFVSDWPPGTSGFAVQLQTLSSTTPVSEVTAAETAASTGGASEVGSLKSDDFASLDPGLYIVYSGMYEGEGARADARKALGRLEEDFPEAKVIRVNSAAEVAKPKEQDREGE